jgi:hypothetical protein
LFQAHGDEFFMITQHRSRISWMTLILCLCIGSLVILPVLSSISLPLPDISEMEYGEEGAIVPTIGQIAADGLSIPFARVNLKLQAASFPPVSPPPKSE